MVKIGGERHASARLWLPANIVFDDIAAKSLGGRSLEQLRMTIGNKGEKLPVRVL
jgi:hypothetical protein